ncbi:histidine kinase [Actibacterium atlanticum]|uniref:histidine kinase n=1 Tax=Actibacterium atlanticum TaxID=1461693 RepID=A0A058ZLF6_9RHOB|nr:response regulator [Actibacterium atlanticum]KCV82045.1 histidine kinase [Actibacterium atlanticum]
MTSPESENRHDTKRAALLGHDIRNAVSDILGGLALADLTPLDLHSQQQLQRVRSAGEQLARLSDEFLALIMGDRAPHMAQISTLILHSYLDEIEARWSARAREAGLNFTLELAADLPTEIGTDKGALDRILTNLIGNATKHTPKGEVILSVGMRSHETLCLKVRDTGAGFSDDALAMLFEVGGRPADTEVPGSGLGLHIVYELAEQIGGRVEVSNHALGGAQAALLLPRKAWAPGMTSPTVAPSELPNLAGQCVLVAEDNQTNQLLVRQMLETMGADCRIASDGVTALHLLEEQHFNLALIDIEMPRLSGLDLIRVLREREREQGPDAMVLPVLAITAYVLRSNRDEIYEAGADGVLAKPIMSIEAFGHAINAVLARRASETATLPPAQDDTAALNNLHLDRLLALAGEHNSRELLSRLLQDFRTVQSGLSEGMQQTDFSLIRARTHVLISLAGAVGSDHLQCLAENLNNAAHNKDHNLTRVLTPRISQQIERVLDRLEGEFASRFNTAYDASEANT